MMNGIERLGLHGPDKCQHHQVPHDRILPLDPRIPLSDLEPRFWSALYLTSLLHQGVHRYAREQEQSWFYLFGAHPLAMTSRGLGCWKPVKPASLLKMLQDDVSMAPLVAHYLKGRARVILTRSMIDPGELSADLLADGDFVREHPIEVIAGTYISEW